MRERSFKLSDLSRAKGHGDFSTINSIAADVPDDANAVFPIEQEDFASDTLTSDTKLPSGDLNIDIFTEPEKPRLVKPVNKPSVAQGSGPETVRNAATETPKPRKATPVKKPTSSTGPVLRPKTVPRLAQPATAIPSTTPLAAPSESKPSVRPIESKAAPFSDRYERITTYLEKPLFSRVHDLHERGEIAKIASLLNAAVREYLDIHYPSP